MVIKTRDKLIEVARQLFAHNGIENTTMNNIAEASDKGRRTIYTYFKNKREIYNAVIASETEQMITKLQELATLPIPPESKLMNFIFRCVKISWKMESIQRERRFARSGKMAHLLIQ